MENSNQYIYGKNTVEEQLKTAPERIDKIFLKRHMLFHQLFHMHLTTGYPWLKFPELSYLIW